MQLRLFVALPVPRQIRELLRDWVEKQRLVWSFTKWVHPQDLHITLQFLGPCTIPQAERIKVALDHIVQGVTSFTLSLDQWGTFGSAKQPRILWMGVKGDLVPLHHLQQKVTTTLASIGFPSEDRPYRPHLTLARKYIGTSFSHVESHDPWIEQEEQTISWQANQLVLFQSHLGRLPMYEPIHSVPFHDAD